MDTDNQMILYWFRTDLRLDDNPALEAAINKAIELECPLITTFIETPKQWEKHNKAPIQIDLIERHLALMQQKLADFKVPLLVSCVDDFAAQSSEIQKLCERHQVSHVYANQEVEVNEQARDANVLTCLNSYNIGFQTFESDVVIPKGRVLNLSGEMYKVFTPFKKAWLNTILNGGFSTHSENGFGLADAKSALEIYKQKGFFEKLTSDIKTTTNICFKSPKVDSNNWPLITSVRDELIPDFYQRIIVRYPEDRDFPGIEGTSRLSPYLAIGALSPRRLVSQLMHTVPNILDNISIPEFTWLNQLIWRDFYRHLLFHFPHLCKHKNFNAKYDGLPWPNNPFLFKAWKEGKTGYPIVDAAMRQLVQTGWMHNRLRMIVASFLTKHLLIDWRLGEAFFSEHLIDSDLANNNGGWQWAAGTGCDAQPYFRIFNPITQSKKFDPQGTFIRKYVPELNRFSDKDIHFPHKVILSEKIKGYWPAIVDHKIARENALDFYKQNR